MTPPAPSFDRRTLLGAGLAALSLSPIPATAQSPATVLAPDLPFIVLGDWGREGAHHQREVGITMGRVAEAARSRFTLSLGDNFYENGVTGVDDPQWVSSFEAIYAAPSLMTPWHVILGNHDYRGDVGAQLGYRGSARWRLPSRYYTRSETLVDGTRADFFHIDTSPFVAAYRGSRTHIDGQDTAAQLVWLERQLAASAAPWKIVVGHHPLFTATGGKHDTPELIGMVKPLLDRYGVQAYLGGHVHNLQEVQVDGVCYVTSGAGSQTGRIKQIERPGFAVQQHGFVLARLSKDALRLTYVDVTGATLRESTIRRI